MHRLHLAIAVCASSLVACSSVPDVEWDADHCTVEEPASSTCSASMRGASGHDGFRIAVDEGSFGARVHFVFTGSGGEIADGDYEVATGTYDETVEGPPGQLFDENGGSGHVVVRSFEFVGVPHEDAGPFGLGRITAERGSFAVDLDLAGYLEQGGEESDADEIIASGELLPAGGGDGSTIVSCTDREATGACTQFDLSDAANPEQRARDIESSCGNAGDGDGKVYAAGPCATPGVASCRGATGTLEEPPESVPLEVVWYSEACDLGLTNDNLRTTCEDTLSGSFEGGC